MLSVSGELGRSLEGTVGSVTTSSGESAGAVDIDQDSEDWYMVADSDKSVESEEESMWVNAGIVGDVVRMVFVASTQRSDTKGLSRVLRHPVPGTSDDAVRLDGTSIYTNETLYGMVH